MKNELIPKYNFEPTGTIDRAFNGNRNFITPCRKELIKHGNMIIELSSGNGLTLGTFLYGVTVVMVYEDWTIKRNDLSECFHSTKEAQSFINELREKYNRNEVDHLHQEQVI